MGGIRLVKDVARVQITFKELDMLTDVEFLILNEDIPTLLSMKYMVKNGMDISLQKYSVAFF